MNREFWTAGVLSVLKGGSLEREFLDPIADLIAVQAEQCRKRQEQLRRVLHHETPGNGSRPANRQAGCRGTRRIDCDRRSGLGGHDDFD